jgi:hypothetical protein
MAKHSQDWEKTKKLFLILLVTWLLVLPLMLVLQIAVRFSASGSGEIGNTVVTVVNIVSLIGGVYGVLGWIPVLIVGIIWAGQK